MMVKDIRRTTDEITNERIISEATMVSKVIVSIL
jgi:hypothetical protein